jgi:hypothetical protein
MRIRHKTRFDPTAGNFRASCSSQKTHRPKIIGIHGEYVQVIPRFDGIGDVDLGIESKLENPKDRAIGKLVEFV